MVRIPELAYQNLGRILKKLPDEFKCPICNKELFIKTYYTNPDYHYEKAIRFNGFVMIVCENDEKCYSPWRVNELTQCSWHVWINSEEINFIDVTNYEHGHLSEMDRVKWMKIYIPVMKKKYPKYYKKIKQLDELYRINVVKEFFKDVGVV